MKTINSFVTRYVGIFLAVAFVFLLPSLSHATAGFTVTQVVANATTTNNQTDVSTTTVANLAQTLASRVLTVHSVPTASTTDTIGSCVITYSVNTPDKLSCAGNTAIINTVTHSSSTAIALALRSMTNVTDPAHGALAIASSSTDASYTTAGNEISTSTIAFTDGTTGAVTSGTPVAGIIGAAQVNTITIGGTVDTGDQFLITIPTGVITYTTQSTDVSVANIATGINAAIQASSTYSGQVFTSTSTSNTVVLTAKTIGTGFTQTSSTINGSSTAEQVSFAPPAGVGPATFSITINASTTSYSDSTGSTTLISAGLASALSGNTSVTCVAGVTYVLCTAKVPGTPFAYSTNVIPFLVTNSGGGMTGGSGGGGGGSPHVMTTVVTPVVTITSVPAVVPVVTTGPVPPTLPAGSTSKIKTTLHYKSRGASVKILQELLASDPTLGFKGTFSGYFGLKTQAALEAFQTKYGVVAAGTSGYGSVGPMTRAMFKTVFGS